jgi:hypothetical protein
MKNMIKSAQNTHLNYGVMRRHFLDELQFDMLFRIKKSKLTRKTGPTKPWRGDAGPINRKNDRISCLRSE